MFQTDLLSIIRSLNTVFTAIDICYTSYVANLLARSGPIPKIKLRKSTSCWLLLYEYITMHGPQNVKIFVIYLQVYYHS